MRTPSRAVHPVLVLQASAAGQTAFVALLTRIVALDANLSMELAKVRTCHTPTWLYRARQGGKRELDVFFALAPGSLAFWPSFCSFSVYHESHPEAIYM